MGEPRKDLPCHPVQNQKKTRGKKSKNYNDCGGASKRRVGLPHIKKYALTKSNVGSKKEPKIEFKKNI